MISPLSFHTRVVLTEFQGAMLALQTIAFCIQAVLMRKARRVLAQARRTLADTETFRETLKMRGAALPEAEDTGRVE